MSETTLRLRTQADVAALRQWSAAVREAREEVARFGGAASSAGGVTGGGGAPTMPGAATAAVGMAPGPAPGGGPPGGTSPAPPGFPQGSGAPMAPPPPPSQGSPPMAPPPPGMSAYAAVAAEMPGGRGGQMVQPGGAVDRSGRFLHGLGATAIGIGLGASLTGFMLSSAQTYLELSKIITVVGQRFREAQGNVISFGGSMGYTRAETAGLVEALGSVTNIVDKSTFRSYTGFARQQGIDPHAALGTFGRLGAMRAYGGKVSRQEMAELMGRAQFAGMDQGRLPEFMQGMMSLGEAGFQSTGQMDWRALMAVSRIPGIAYGDDRDPRATGQAGASMIQGLHGVMTGGGPMQTFMMRAMGYGTAGGPGYIEMRKRTEAGVYDPRNVSDLFGAMRARGFGEGTMFKALESVSGGRLTAYQMEALVKNFGTESGQAKFLETYGSGGEGMGRFLASVSDEDYDRYEAGGFEAMGRTKVSRGERRSVKMENMRMVVGDPVSEAMVDLTDTIVNLAGTLKNLIGIDLGKILTDSTEAMKQLSATIERGTRTGGSIRKAITSPVDMMPDEAFVNAAETQKRFESNVDILQDRFLRAIGATEAGGGQ